MFLGLLPSYSTGWMLRTSFNYISNQLSNVLSRCPFPAQRVEPKNGCCYPPPSKIPILYPKSNDTCNRCRCFYGCFHCLLSTLSSSSRPSFSLSSSFSFSPSSSPILRASSSSPSPSPSFKTKSKSCSLINCCPCPFHRCSIFGCPQPICLCVSSFERQTGCSHCLRKLASKFCFSSFHFRPRSQKGGVNSHQFCAASSGCKSSADFATSNTFFDAEEDLYFDCPAILSTGVPLKDFISLSAI